MAQRAPGTDEYEKMLKVAAGAIVDSTMANDRWTKRSTGNEWPSAQKAEAARDCRKNTERVEGGGRGEREGRREVDDDEGRNRWKKRKIKDAEPRSEEKDDR